MSSRYGSRRRMATAAKAGGVGATASKDGPITPGEDTDKKENRSSYDIDDVCFKLAAQADDDTTKTNEEWHEHKHSSKCVSDSDCSSEYTCEQGQCVVYQPDRGIEERASPGSTRVGRRGSPRPVCAQNARQRARRASVRRDYMVVLEGTTWRARFATGPGSSALGGVESVPRAGFVRQMSLPPRDMRCVFDKWASIWSMVKKR